MEDNTSISDNNNSASSLTFRSYNARSIGKHPKRRQILHYIKEKNDDINIIVDTRFSKKIENKVKAEWGGGTLFSAHILLRQGGWQFLSKKASLLIS